MKWVNENCVKERKNSIIRKMWRNFYQNVYERKKTVNLKNHTHASRFIQMSLQYNRIVISFAQQQEKVLCHTTHAFIHQTICIFIKKYWLNALTKRKSIHNKHEKCALAHTLQTSLHTEWILFSSSHQSLAKWNRTAPNGMEWTTNFQVYTNQTEKMKNKERKNKTQNESCVACRKTFPKNSRRSLFYPRILYEMWKCSIWAIFWYSFRWCFSCRPPAYLTPSHPSTYTSYT